MDVAIVGMAALMPGAPTLEHYWRNLVSGVDAITDVPPNKWDPEFYDPEQAHRPDRLYCKRGGFVDDFATFEPLRFGVMPSSIPFIEPDQLIALEVAAAAFDDAGGVDRLPDRDRVGVIVGRGGVLSPAQARYAQRVRMPSQVLLVLKELMPDLDDHRLELVRKLFEERLGPHQPEGTIGLVPNLTASRIANRFNLRGPAYTVDAACASSLIAVDQGITELLSGRLDVVLAGGVHHVHDSSFWSVFSQLGALSRRGEIRPFDRAADGLLIGEGTGLVVLKRMADARRDGDRVYAAIRGIGTSSDGRSASMFNPATAGQTLAIRRAWQAAGLDPTSPDALGLLEAHGTGTPTGDAAELSTLAEVFGPPLSDAPVVGSVKSMIGHTMPAAGIAGLIKAALAVSRGMLLPTLHCDDPLPQLAQTRFRTLREAKAWESEGPRRAGVNSFGFGGINAHIILEEVPHMTTTTVAPPIIREPDRLLLLSAPDTAAMARLLEDGDVLRMRPGTELGCRLGIVNPTPDRLAIARKAVAAGKPWRGGWDVWFSPRPLLADGKLAFVFPGLEAEFKPRMGEVAAHFGLPNREWSMEDLGEHGAGVIEVGKLLDDAMRRMGVHPDAVAGHSIGEWAAAATTGLMSTASMDEFLAVFQSESAEIPGRMFAFIGAGVDRTEPMLADYPGVVISHDNAPTQCCVNGPTEQVERLIEALRRDHIISQPLPFRSAFHTPAFADGLAAVATALRHWTVNPPSCPVWSATLAAPYPSDPDEVTRLFTRHMMEPVRFGPTVAAMYDAGIRVFLQVGTGQLSSVVAENLRGRGDHMTMPVNTAHRDGLEQLRCVATALWVEGGTPDFHALSVAEPTGVKLDLGGPLVRLGEGAAGLLGVTGRSHEATTLDRLAEKNSLAAELAALLRETEESAAEVLSVVALDEGKPAEQRETLRVSLATMPYLKHHCFFVQPEDWPHPEDRWPVVPATTVVQLMMDAAEKAAGAGMRAIAVRDARFHRWVIAAPEQDVEVVTQRQDGNRFAVSFGPFARATVEVAAAYPTDAPPPFAYDASTETAPTLSAAEMYAERLMFHGPLFQALTEVHALGPMHARGIVTTPTPPGALLDNTLQLIGNWLITTQPRRTVALPVAFGAIRMFGPPPPAGKALQCIARVRSIDDSQLVGDTQLIDPGVGGIGGGRVWAVIEGVVDRRFDSHPTARPAERFPERYPMSRLAPQGFTLAFDCWTDPVTLSMAAHAILGGRAHADFDRLPGAERKRWLLGRIAAKDAVRFRQWDAGLRDVYPIELTIRDEPGGGHSVRLESPRLRPCFVSLASCGDMGVALAGDGPVGIAAAESPADRDALAREAIAKAGGIACEVRFAEVSNPDDLPSRTYTIAFTVHPGE